MQAGEETTLQERLSPQELKSFVRLLAALPQEENPAFAALLQEAGQGKADVVKLLHTLSDMHPAAGSEAHAALSEIFKSDAYHKLLLGEALKQWTMKPEQVTGSREVEEEYQKLEKGLFGIREALSEHGAAQSGAMRSAVSLSQNVDFMNQLNQMYTYVQLPLKMHNGHANGELYVYTNKRSLAKSDGSVSALLHLDMEHLGPLDVYVTMKDKQVATNFTVADDEVLTLIEDNIDLLNQRLEGRGYSLKAQMHVKEADGEEEDSTIMQTLLSQQKNISVLSRTSFDMRA